MLFIGADGDELELNGNNLRIKKGKKDVGRIINLNDIVSVVYLKPVFTACGCIYIQVYGGKIYPSVANITHYVCDMNAITFRKKSEEEALAFKEALEKAISETKTNKENSEDEELRRFKKLLDEGLISQEDYDKKKNQILGF